MSKLHCQIGHLCDRKSETQNLIGQEKSTWQNLSPAQDRVLSPSTTLTETKSFNLAF